MANSGDQVIVHVNSHGANAKVLDLLAANNPFSNFTIKPIEIHAIMTPIMIQ